MPKEIKSFQQQLQDALDAGNLEAAKLVVEAMKIANKPVKKPRKKKAVAKKPKTAKKEVQPKQVESEPKKELIIPTQEEIVDLTSYDDEDDDDVEDMTGEDRPKQRRKGTKPGENLCRIEPMNLRGRKMEFFNGNKRDGDALEDSTKANPTLAKMYARADAIRPEKEKRKAVKARVKCYACGKIEVIPIDLAPNVAKGEGYKCNDCVTGQGE